MKKYFPYLIILMFVGIILLICGNPLGAWIFVPSMTLSVIFIVSDKKE